MYGLSERAESQREKHHRGRGTDRAGTDQFNVWATCGSVIKYFRIPWRECLWGISWQNIQMLVISIPDTEEDKKRADEVTPDEIDDIPMEG